MASIRHSEPACFSLSPSSNVQLFERMREKGWADEDRQKAGAAYDLICRHFVGVHRPDARLFAQHLVRTAGILLDDGADPHTVLTGLLHSAYTHGDWGLKDTIDHRRSIVRQAVGEEVEALVFAYSSFRYSHEAIARLVTRASDAADYGSNSQAFTALERQIIQIRIANELEQALDNALWYLVPDRQMRNLEKLDLTAKLALALGFTALGEAIGSALAGYAAAADCASRGFTNAESPTSSYHVLSPSTVRLKRPLLTRAKGRLKRLLANVRATR